MSIEGRIQIDLHRRPDGGCDPAISSTRPFGLPKMFVGRPAAEVATLVGSLFRLCGRAQMMASLTAMEAALGMSRCQITDRCRAAGVIAELGREHTLNLLSVGAGSAGVEPIADLKAAFALGRQADALAPEVWRLGGRVDAVPAGVDQLADNWSRWLDGAVFDGAPADWLRLSTNDFELWCQAGRTRAARETAELIADDKDLWASASPGHLTSSDIDFEALIPDDADTSGLDAAPGTTDGPRETGPFSRQRQHPRVADIVSRHGFGPLARRTARLIELAEVPTWLSEFGDGAPGIEATLFGTGAGRASAIETVRGLLVHAVKLDDDGTVAGYRIVAPTEWNFHPDGVAARALRGLKRDDDWRMTASRVTDAIDPCVTCNVRVH